MNDATREELWTIAEDDYPAGGTAAERLRFLAGYAVLAPSVHNIQPWRFRLTGERIELRADRSRALPVRDPDDRELLLSCGAALFHLRLALRRFGHAGEVVLWPDAADPDLFARLGFGPAAEPTAEERTEFAAIPHRRTHRGPLAPRPVPTAVLTELRVLAAEEGAWLHLVESEPERAALVALIEEADRLQAADPALQQELPARVRERAPLAGDAGGASGVPLAADAQVLAVLLAADQLAHVLAAGAKAALADLLVDEGLERIRQGDVHGGHGGSLMCLPNFGKARKSLHNLLHRRHLRFRTGDRPCQARGSGGASSRSPRSSASSHCLRGMPPP